MNQARGTNNCDAVYTPLGSSYGSLVFVSGHIGLCCPSSQKGDLEAWNGIWWACVMTHYSTEASDTEQEVDMRVNSLSRSLERATCTSDATGGRGDEIPFFFFSLL